MTEMAARRRGYRWWSVGGVVIGIAALVWVFVRVDYDRMQHVIAQADIAVISSAGMLPDANSSLTASMSATVTVVSRIEGACVSRLANADL